MTLPMSSASILQFPPNPPSHPILQLLKSIQFQATKEDHRRTLNDAINHAYEGPQDLIIISSDNEEIHTNSFPLCVLSPVLRVAASSPCCITPTILLPDCSSSSIKHLLSIITRGFTVLEQVSYTETNNILETAKILSIDIKSFWNGKLSDVVEPRKYEKKKDIELRYRTEDVESSSGVELSPSLTTKDEDENSSLLLNESNNTLKDPIPDTPTFSPRFTRNPALKPTNADATRKLNFSSLSTFKPNSATKKHNYSSISTFKTNSSKKLNFSSISAFKKRNSFASKRRNSFVSRNSMSFTPKRRTSFKSLSIKGMKGGKLHITSTLQNMELEEPIEKLPAPVELMTLFELQEWLIPQLKADLAEQGKGSVEKIKWGNEKHRPACWDESFPWIMVRNPKKIQNKIPAGVNFICVLKQTVRNRLAMKQIDHNTYISQEKNNLQTKNEKSMFKYLKT